MRPEVQLSRQAKPVQQIKAFSSGRHLPSEARRQLNVLRNAKYSHQPAGLKNQAQIFSSPFRSGELWEVGEDQVTE